MDEQKWIKRLERERKARKEAEELLESKSLELWNLNQSLEQKIQERTISLQNALDSAKEANNSKDQFLSNMSHEIRTPLNAILGFIDIMLIKKLDTQKSEKYLKIIKQSGQNLLNIINDILDFSKIQSGNFNIDLIEVNLKNSMLNCCSLFKSQTIEKGINYNYSVCENFPQLLIADETRITQVINNFINNAIKFTPSGKDIKVSFEYDYKKSIFKAKVKDSGIGIEKEKQKKIFSPFEQENSGTTREYGGTGLGLSISLSLINMMGGELIFESEKDKGSLFGFKIPLSIPESIKIDKIEEKKEKKHILKAHILVAEDNMTNQMLIEIILKELGISCKIVANGIEAIKEMKINSYDMILMDYNMPELSGIEATKEIRKFNPTIPIVALSASVQQKDIDSFLDAGMNDALAKPIDITLMGEILNKYLKLL